MYRVADSAPIPAQALAGRLGIPVAELDQRLTELLTAGYLTLATPADPSPPPTARRAAAGTAPADGDRPGAAAGATPAAGDGTRAGSGLALTAAGQQVAARLDVAREAGIDRLATDWEPDRIPELRELLGRITRTLVATDVAPEHDGAAAQAAAPR